MTDDNEPPAAGCAVVSFEPVGPSPSMAPNAEPKHRANPAEAVAL
jgi:hypothetical protein